MRRSKWAIAWAAAALIAWGCSGDDDGGGGNTTTPTTAMTSTSAEGPDMAPSDSGAPSDQGPRLRFDPSSEDFFALPFPEDARRKPDGSLGFVDWPRASVAGSVPRLWLEAADELARGWGLMSGVFVYFDRELDTATLPESIDASATTASGWPSVFLIDVDPDSSERGRLFPLSCKYTDAQGTYHAAHQLGCYTPFGILRRPKTRYALVTTTALRAADGDPIGADSAMRALLEGQDVEGRWGTIAGAPYSEARDYIAGQGLAVEAIANIVLLTTGDPVRRFLDVNAWYAALPEPELKGALSVARVYDDYVVLEGRYEVPQIQEGPKPYNAPPSGRIVFDDQGAPVVQGNEELRFYLTIPRRAMPAGGYAIASYHHGSGGVAEQLLDRGAVNEGGAAEPPGNGPARTMAAYNIAGFATDFPLHGARHSPPDTTGLQLYNLFGNPRAAIDNFVVAANEITLHHRLLARLTIDPSLSPELGELAPQGEMIRFNPDRMSSIGQSMGSWISIPSTTFDLNLDAAVFSGSGGVLAEIGPYSKSPIDVGRALRALYLRLRPDEDLDHHDPLLHGFQHVWDIVEPVVHARHVFLEPHPGFAPKHALHHSGLTDGYFTPAARAAVATALGTPLAQPVEEPFALDVLKYVGLPEAVALPIVGNGPSGVTALSAQYQPFVRDGHYVMFQRDDTKAQYGCFMATVGMSTAPEFRAPDQATPQLCSP